ncbi:hypothetical protein GCM10020255_061770 [Rhodococcus baikonurensis]
MHSLADAQCLLSQFVDDASGGLLRVRRCVGRTDLAENLLFADHHRVEATGHGEEMFDRCFAVADVRVSVQRRQIETRMVGQDFTDLGECTVERVHHRVDLHPVAGGDDHRFGDVRRRQKLVDQLRTIGVGNSHSLEHRDGRGSMRDPDKQNTHGAITDPFLVEPAPTGAGELVDGTDEADAA